MTAGGVIGEVVFLKDDEVTIRSGESKLVIERGKLAVFAVWIDIRHVFGAVGTDESGKAATAGRLIAHQHQRNGTIREIRREIRVQLDQGFPRIAVEAAECKNALEQCVRGCHESF